jgi:hypothetical protein
MTRECELVLTVRWLYTHVFGRRLLSDKLGLTLPTLIYIPTSPDELILPSVVANTTSHNTVSHNTAPPFPISLQFQQTSPFVTWPSTPLYIQGSNSASIDNQSGQAPCSEVERSANMQLNIQTQFAQQSYLDFSVNSMHDLSSEAPQQGSFWGESSETPQGIFWSDSDV